MKRKKNKKLKEKTLDERETKNSAETQADSPSRGLIEQIRRAAEGLYYISETDAVVLPFAGTNAKAVTKEELLKQISAAPGLPVEEKSFTEFFTRLTEMQDWYGDEEKEIAGKFARLKEVLENNIRDLKVFRIGKIELDIYVVGLDAEDIFLGIKTKAVET